MTFSVLNLLLVLVAAFGGGRLALRLGYPAVLGEILMGIVLGPPLLGLMHSSPDLTVLADLGVLLMMMYVGMEVSLGELARASRVGVLTALGGFLLPLGLGVWLMLTFGNGLTAALFVGVAMGVTSLATKSRILLDLDILDTRIANVMMAGALVTDTVSLLFFAGIISVATAGTFDVLSLGLLSAKAVTFFIAAWFLGVRLFPYLYRWLRNRGLTGRSFYVPLALMIALAFAELAELAGLHGVIGAFLAGMFLREAIEEHRLSHELTELVRDVSVGFLAPVFFVTAGFEVSFGVFTTNLPLLLTVIGVATVAKIIGTLLAYLLTNGSWREGFVIGLGMNDRGAVEIILAGVALRVGLIDAEIFSILVVMAVATTATVPLFLTWGVRWLEARGELVRSAGERQSAVIVGAGPVARVLAKELKGSRPVTLIDANADNCAEAEAEGLRAVHGDALEDIPLRDAGVEDAGLVISLTPNPGVNVLVAKQAAEVFKVPEVYALLTGKEGGGLYRQLELVGAKPLFAQGVSLLEWDRKLVTHQAETRLHSVEQNEEFTASDASKAELLPLLVKRGDEHHLFSTLHELKSGDEVFYLKSG